MSWELLLVQALNGFQFGVMLFLMAAGLTLVFGIMNLVNLAHGSLYMMGAYFAATFQAWTGSWVAGVALALPASFALGLAIDRVALRTLYDRDHLDQVLATFGLILFFNELARIVWGASPFHMKTPSWLDGHVEIVAGIPYPLYRLAIIGVGIAVATLLFLVISRTRLGMLIRASASNGEMAGALGVDTKILFTFVFGLGAVFAGVAGLMVGPVSAILPGMGEPILILTFVVIVIGGIGSIRGAFVAAVLIGIVDTTGRVFLRTAFKRFLVPEIADTLGPAVASMLIYILMAAILFFRPAGLFPARKG
ncbi:MAG: branched-chain amino acid ABC transporter permease [Alphaproteobacteria bacterium]|nr:branched-chain amino acid ABC transporter permease [Alphaproteobacteria bacterium]